MGTYERTAEWQCYGNPLSLSYSQFLTPLYGHLLNTDTHIKRAVLFVPTKSSPGGSSHKIKASVQK